MMPLCAFTSAESTRSGRRDATVCECTLKHWKEFPMIGCVNCNRAKTTWRCMECYSSLAARIRKENLKAKSRKQSPILSPSIELLLDIDFNQTRLLHRINTAFTLFSLDPLRLIWKNSCPSCDYVYIPRCPPMKIEGFDSIYPSTSGKMVQISSPTIDAHSESWQLTHKVWKLYVLRADEVVPKRFEKELKHRYQDSHLRNGYLVIHSVPERHAGIDHCATIIYSNGQGLTSNLMSALVGKKKHSATTGQRLERCLDMSHVQKKCSLGATKAKNQRGGLAFHSIRVNRSGGSHRHMDDCQSDAVKTMVCDANGMGAIPRRPESTVMIPYANETGLVTRFSPFYVSTSQEYPNWVTPRHASPPRLSSLCTGERLIVNAQHEGEDVVQFLYDLACTRINIAHLLLELADIQEQVSIAESLGTVRVFHLVRTIYQEKGNRNHSSGKSIDVISMGDYVFFQHGDMILDGLTRSFDDTSQTCTIMHLASCAGNRIISTVACDNVFCFSEVETEAVAEIMPITLEETIQTILLLKGKGLSMKEALIALCKYTGMGEAVGNHQDDYDRNKSKKATKAAKKAGCTSSSTSGRSVESLIQGKAVIEVGRPTHGLALPPSGTVSSAPLGSLCYPMYKICTVCTTECFEMQALHSITHGGVGVRGPRFDGNTLGAGQKRKKTEQLAAKNSVVLRRGCWSGGKFYEKGFACMDWSKHIANRKASSINK